MARITDDDLILQVGYWCDVEGAYYEEDEESHCGYPCTFEQLENGRWVDVPHQMYTVALVKVPSG